MKTPTPKFEKGQYIKYRTIMGFRAKYYTWEIVKLDWSMYRYKLQRVNAEGHKISRWLAFTDQSASFTSAA